MPGWRAAWRSSKFRSRSIFIDDGCSEIMKNAGLQRQIIEALRTIPPEKIQRLAEAIALQKFPERFRTGTLIRNGRNDDAQTTKNWPDAFATTSDKTVDGIEATRDKNNWRKHLETDLQHSSDPKYLNLSGYVFVGGYPDSNVTSEEIRDWIEKFAAIGLPHERITILIGRDLVAELEEPAYAAVRRRWLGLLMRPKGFRSIARPATGSAKLDVFQPTEEEFENGYVGAPLLLSSVLDLLDSEGACLVRGVGAAGKTTLARLVSHSDRVMPNPTWLLDFANEAFDEDEAIEGMAEGAGRGVLFVLDNIHLDTAAADRIVRHWREHIKAQGARLLLLGRKTKFYVSDLAGLSVLELRAGIPEMEAVVSRLFNRQSLRPPVIDGSFLETWSLEFGGSVDPGLVAVDLVAFSAAVDQRMGSFAKGDFRLTAEDAIRGVNARYLEPLDGKVERDDLLLLASLAYFEIPIFPELISAFPNFNISIDELGIVIEEQNGLEHRPSFRLVHHALGKLLLKASPSYDVQAARESIARRNPSIGAWMVSNKRPASGKPEIEKAMQDSVISGAWKASVVSCYDLAAIIRIALGRGWCEAGIFDRDLVSDGWLDARIVGVRSLRSLNSLSHWLRKFTLVNSQERITALAADEQSRLHGTILVSPMSEVVSLLRNHDANGAVLTAISSADWDKRQAHVPPESADVVVAGARFLERIGRGDMARVPCLNLIHSADPAYWSRSDLAHLSHVLRLAGHPEPGTTFLLDALAEHDWFERAYRQSNIGPLCGALMSLANHIRPDHRATLLTPTLMERAECELKGEFWLNSKKDAFQGRGIRRNSPSIVGCNGHEGQAWLANKALSRPICLIGSISCLGHTTKTVEIDWKPQLLERMFEGLRTKNDSGTLGMYELQFWTGLKVLAKNGHAPNQAPAVDGERFLATLEQSAPPTEAAERIQVELVDWLRKIKSRNWILY